jgi:hypothetical protein
MVVPLLGRWLAAVAGGLLVLVVWGSVIGTLLVPRPVGSRLTRWVDRLVDGGFGLVTAAIADYRRRDRVLVGQAAAILLMQLAAWLGVAFVGYGLLLWPLVTGGLGQRSSSPGPRCSPSGSGSRQGRRRRWGSPPRRPAW